MNISVIIGLVLATLLMTFGIVFDSDSMSINFATMINFVDVPSMLITIGGTFATLMASFPLKYFAALPAHMKIILGIGAKYDPIYYINAIAELSMEARKKGLLALEDSVSEYEDQFLKDSIMLIVDAMEPDKVREQIEIEMNGIESRHASAWNIYDRGASLAPGFGMLGTLIGLINMLAAMDFSDEGGAGKLATNMAVALITTYYGSILANVVFMPLGNQLRVKHEEEMLCKEIILEGVISIQAGENPRHIREKLTAYLTKKQRAVAAESTSEG